MTSVPRDPELMMPNSPAPPSAGRIAVWMLLLCAIAGLSHVLDSAAYPEWVSRSAEGKDWNRLLRVAGFVPTWLIVGGGLALAWSARGGAARWWARASLVPTGAMLGGLVAEIGKLLIRRQRPDESGGAYVLVPFDQNTWDTGALGLPSSHAGVAFGAAFAVMMLWPRAGWLVVVVALGCGLTRVMAGRHFVSDTIAGAPAGYLGAAAGAWILALIARRLKGGKVA